MKTLSTVQSTIQKVNAMKITEIEITPIKPNKGLVAFASCVIDSWLYLSSMGIVTRLDGGYRLTYPTKNIGRGQVNIFHPVTHEAGNTIEEKIISTYEEVMKKSNDRYNRVGT